MSHYARFCDRVRTKRVNYGAGFEYKFDPINKFTNEKNLVYKDGLTIEVCDKSIFYLLGTNIDWNENIMGKGFKFDNPMAQTSCGCGTSFSPKL